MQVRKSVIAAIALRYQKERKKQKGFILNDSLRCLLSKGVNK
jgi:hypothetical protein